MRWWIVSLVAAGLSSAVPAQAASHGHYLFVWTADQAKVSNDFLAVIDADPASPHYGKLVAGVGTDIKSVRIHHTEYEMPASGMLFANDHDSNQTVVFDLRDPLKPSVAARFSSLAGYGMPHSFLRLPNGNVLASFQFGDHTGHGDHKAMMNGKSGGLVEIDDAGKAIRAVGNADPALPEDGLLPYSLAVLPKIDRVVVTNSPMQDAYLLSSNTYQIFRLSDLKLLGTYRLDPGPTGNGNVAPEEARVAADGSVYVQTLSCGIQRITGLDTPEPKAKLVHKFPGDFCGVPTIVGRYLVQSVPTIHGFAVLDIGNPDAVREVSRLTIDGDFSPHWTAWDAKAKRLVITSGRQGDRLYLLKLDQKTGALSIDDGFRDTDGKRGFSFATRKWPHGWTGEGTPHGAVFSR
ncbi:selenium-binding family protein [Sphingomonas alba]|uniref:Selenium-binding family protein n=1 Tax=Sphingomonas alba TaxID=2908208 RepID=A0ABT0RJI3_9SPHN|nr:selenium-binding family protein [Sphingomonas alba]MCL6682747.1 selenium-binding family protein [Sphingomonas alba]